MRKIILNVAVSLDGYIEGPTGEYDWCFTDQDYGLSDFFQRVDSVFYGRKSYELMEKIGEDSIPGMPKLTEYVFSTTRKDFKPEVTLISENVEAAVRQIKQQPGKDIWLFGGASLSTTLMNLQLVDELLLAVHPIVLGAGKPLFTGIEKRIPLKLLNTVKYETGLVSLRYSLAEI